MVATVCIFRVFKAEAQALRERLEREGDSHPPELNGDGVGAESAEVESAAVKEELQRTLEALKKVETSKMNVENLLAEAKQAREQPMK